MKYGFVYIWFDRKHKRFYIGSHWGTTEDGYVCSSTWMRNAYKRRPRDFRRRILKTDIDRSALIIEEQLWLNLIHSEEIGKRYYNLNKNAIKHWHTDPQQRRTVGQKISASPLRAQRIGEALKGRKPSGYTQQRKLEATVGRRQSKEEIQRRIDARKGYRHSSETKQKLSQPKQQVVCPHCNKQGGKPIMKRFHFDNCRHK